MGSDKAPKRKLISGARAEAAFALNLRTARTAKGITQAELAEHMAKQGFSWHPPTVYKVESNERQIQLGEALELAQFLGIPVDQMATTDGEANHRIEIESAYLELVEARGDLFSELQRYLEASVRLATRLQTYGGEKVFSAADLKRLRGLSKQDSELHKALRRSETLLMRTDE